MLEINNFERGKSGYTITDNKFNGYEIIKTVQIKRRYSFLF